MEPIAVTFYIKKGPYHFFQKYDGANFPTREQKVRKLYLSLHIRHNEKESCHLCGLRRIMDGENYIRELVKIEEYLYRGGMI